MNLDLTQLFPDLEALTPDDRWELLQEWLRENPKYAKKIDRWVNQTPDEVFIQLCEERGGLPVRAVKAIIGVTMHHKILSAIETMQACYRERAAYNNQQLEKEIKNARQIKPSKKPRRARDRARARPKRTAQD